MLVFSTPLLRNYKMGTVETCYANAVWYEDDAHVCSIGKI